MATERFSTIDLRSDTVTKPTPAMRKAMAEAEVGDDVAGDDPTVNRLQDYAAERLGKEAGLFVPSGSMGNTVCALAWCQPGDAIVMDRFAHTRIYEVGALTAVGGILMDPVPALQDGQPDPDGFEAEIRPNNLHSPRTRLLWIENTSNRAGGAVVTPETTARIRSLADRYGLALHIDGARIWNSAVAQGCDASELVAPADSVMFCFSKGLCAPIGSMVLGTREFIEVARRKRKMLGGGMRQVGVVAAAAMVALETMVDRLAEDHWKAAELASGIAAIPGLELAGPPVRTNMVYFSTVSLGVSAAAFAERLCAAGVLCYPTGDRIRLVTHHDVPSEAIPVAVERIGREAELTRSR